MDPRKTDFSSVPIQRRFNGVVLIFAPLPPYKHSI